MANQNLSVEPYYDRYIGDSPHKKAGYTRVLAKPGFAEQSAEFNEIQSIARDYIERLGTSLYKDGFIVSGCTININGTVVTVGAGRIFLEGLIRDVKETVLTISAVGVERVVAVLTTDIITASNDMSLRDPAQGAENYGMEGADRLREVVTIKVVEDEVSSDGVEIFTLVDGAVAKEESTSSDNFSFNNILAERTFDENGSYKVRGLFMRDLPEVLGDKIKIYITDGKAYVLGFAVTKGFMSHVLLDQSTETRLVQSESHYYSSSKSKYELSNGPIANVNNLTCLVSVIGERKYRGSVRGGYDAMNYTPVDSIVRVYTKNSDGSILHTYRQGVDYKLYNDQVDWSLVGDNAQEPVAGTTYYVDYVYNKSMIQGQDFSIENDLMSAYINFLAGGDKPDENSRMYISYTYTLARRDLVLMDKNGDVQIIKGEPDKLKALITPYNGSDDFLELGHVDVYPTNALTSEVTGAIANVVNYDSIRFTQENFYTMLQRIDTLEEGMAQLDLERSIEEGEDIASLKGYFTDSFANINKSDLSYRALIGNKEIAYTACIDYDMAELTTAADIASTDLIINNQSSDAHAIYGTIISAPYVAELAIQQRYVTGTMLVNPYASYGPMCQVILNPPSDNWVDEKTVKVNNTINNTSYTYNTKTYSHGYWSRNATHNLRGFLRTETKTTTSYAGKTTSNNVTSSVASTLYEYMRQRTITVQGKAFSGGMRDIFCKFNDIPVNLTAKNGTKQGNQKTVNGVSVTTVNANENGSFEATFQIPKNVPCGTVKVTFTGQNELGEEYTGQSNYQAVGTLLTTTIKNTTTITSHYNVLTEVDNLYSSDPLAQSFMLSQEYDRVLIKLGLYFATKSPNRPAILQVRNMVNGYPGETVYAEMTLEPEMVNIPSNSNVPVVTEVTLNQPVYCKKNTYYCFVILSDSNAYSMYYANMGDNILGTKEQLVINPYATGVLFSSSNSSTWTAHQGADLKFELYRSRYTGKGEIIFDEANTKDVTGIFLDAAYQDNNNVGLTWFYRYMQADNTYTPWLPIDTLTFRDLQAVTQKVSLKAVINTDYSTSPYIDASRVSLRAFIDQKEAIYISQHLTKDDFDEPYQQLRISYQVAMPTGADHKVYYMDTLGGDWVEIRAGENVSLETRQVSEEFTQYTWTIKKLHCIEANPASPGAEFFKIRVDLTTTLAYNRPRMKQLAAIFRYN